MVSRLERKTPELSVESFSSMLTLAGMVRFRETGEHMERRLSRRIGVSTLAGLLSATGLMAAIVAQAPPAMAMVACGETITVNTTLDADVGPCPANGIIIGADGITLDLNSHQVFGTTTSGEGAGVLVSSHSNVTVKNGNVRLFDGGVLIRNGGHNVVTGITAQDNIGLSNLGDGIAIEGSSDNSILNNTAATNGPFSGIAIYQNADGDHGFPTAPAINNLIQGNRVLNNTACRPGGGICDNDGVRVEPGVSPGNTIDANTITGNGLDGISIFGQTSGVTITNNKLSLNGFLGAVPGDGIRIFGYANTVSGNRSLNNKAGGISVGRRTTAGPGDLPAPNARDNQIFNNTATGNGVWDLWDSFASAPCDNNLWTGNRYVKASPVCTTAGGTQIQPPLDDFDNDGQTNISVFRPSTATWYVKGTGTNPDTTVTWGTGTDIPVAADYDGDGRTDVAFFRPSNGIWYIKLTTGGESFVQWGAQGDIPVPADYDGDGKADFAVFRPSSGTWYLKRANGLEFFTSWGAQGDIPVSADYDGDGKADIAVFRPTSATWYILNSVGGTTATQFGTAGDIPVPADYVGDGKTELAVFRPSTSTWFVAGGPSVNWGTTGDIPVPGVYSGSGKASIAVFRPNTGTWFVMGDGNLVVPFGINGDQPLPLPSAVRQVFFM